jgi:hypothetical protein
VALVRGICRLVRAEFVVGGDRIIAEVPRTASAFGPITWGIDNHLLVFNAPAGSEDSKPQPADIVVYVFSHAGIVSRNGDSDHDFYAIEGNTNPNGGRDGYEVAERGRRYGSVKRSIRIPA